MTIAAVGGALALRVFDSLNAVFLALGLALATFGVINAVAVACGVWFSKSEWQMMRQQASLSVIAAADGGKNS